MNETLTEGVRPAATFETVGTLYPVEDMLMVPVKVPIEEYIQECEVLQQIVSKNNYQRMKKYNQFFRWKAVNTSIRETCGKIRSDFGQLIRNSEGRAPRNIWAVAIQAGVSLFNSILHARNAVSLETVQKSLEKETHERKVQVREMVQKIRIMVQEAQKEVRMFEMEAQATRILVLMENLRAEAAAVMQALVTGNHGFLSPQIVSPTLMRELHVNLTKRANQRGGYLAINSVADYYHLPTTAITYKNAAFLMLQVPVAKKRLDILRMRTIPFETREGLVRIVKEGVNRVVAMDQRTKLFASLHMADLKKCLTLNDNYFCYRGIPLTKGGSKDCIGALLQLDLELVDKHCQTEEVSELRVTDLGLEVLVFAPKELRVVIRCKDRESKTVIRTIRKLQRLIVEPSCTLEGDTIYFHRPIVEAEEGRYEVKMDVRRLGIEEEESESSEEENEWLESLEKIESELEDLRAEQDRTEAGSVQGTSWLWPSIIAVLIAALVFGVAMAYVLWILKTKVLTTRADPKDEAH